MAGNEFAPAGLGISGIKKSEFVSGQDVLGPDFRLEEIPDGVRFYIKNQQVDLANKRIVVNLYELRRVEGGLKLRRDHLEKFINKIPDDDYIGLEYGPCAPDVEGYVWMGKWTGLDNKENGVMSETIFISERWRDRHEAYKREKAMKAGIPVPAAVGGNGSANASAAGGQPLSALDILTAMQQGEDRAIKNMERIAIVIKGTQNETPSEAMVKMSEAMGRMFEKTMESQLQTVRKVGEQTARAIEKIEEEDEEEENGEGEEVQVVENKAGLPGWLIPFMPKIEQGLSHLLGGGPVAAGVKALIVTSDEWKQIFADPEKWGQAVAAMQEKYGQEKTQKALDILLSRRPEKKGAAGAGKKKRK